MVRAAFALLTVAAFAAFDCRPVVAEIYRPWCVQYGAGNGDSSTSCAFTSYEQCMLTARGAGGICVQNPWYLQYGSGQKGSESVSQGGRPRR